MIEWLLEVLGLTQEEVGDEPEVGMVIIVNG